MFVYIREKRTIGTVQTVQRDISAWDALVWAYQTECVRALGEEAAGRYVNDRLRSFLALSGTGRGNVPTGEGDWHLDAVTIHHLLLTTIAGEARWQVMKAAETGELPLWRLELEPLRALPVMRHTRCGRRPKMLYRKTGRHEPYMCLVAYEGVPEDHRIVLQQRQMDVWLAFTTLLRDMAMKNKVGELHMEK